QRALPVRGDEGEIVPATVEPFVGDGVAFEDEVVDTAFGQMPADRQAGLSRADDDHIAVLDAGGRDVLCAHWFAPWAVGGGFEGGHGQAAGAGSSGCPTTPKRSTTLR